MEGAAPSALLMVEQSSAGVTTDSWLQPAVAPTEPHPPATSPLRSPLFTSDLPDLLHSLVDRSLVTYDEPRGRYRLLETVRQYARERLADSNEPDSLRAHHRRYFLKIAEEAKEAIGTPEQPTWMDRIAVEDENLSDRLLRAARRLAVPETAGAAAAAGRRDT